MTTNSGLKTEMALGSYFPTVLVAVPGAENTNGFLFLPLFAGLVFGFVRPNS